MKYLFLIADGMGDWPLTELGDKTPLEAARTPRMDALAARARMGVCHTVPGGMAPGSDVANMSLLGFDPAAHHTGRGPIEAAAMGLDVGPDDLIWRFNLVTVDQQRGVMRDHSAGHIDGARADELVRGMQAALGNETFTLHPGVSYRHILVQKGGGTTPAKRLHITPPHDILDRELAQDARVLASHEPLAQFIAGCNAYLAEHAADTAANAVWPWGQGGPLALPAFKDTFGLTGAVITAVDLIRGLGRAAGMKGINVEGATGLIDTNYEGKVSAALDFLHNGGNFVFVHLEGPDECGHSGDAAAKTEAIRRFDERVVGPLQDALEGQDACFVITCDHFTPICERTHTTDAVPYMIVAPGLTPTNPNADHFSERMAAHGEVIDPGHTFLRHVLDLTQAK